MAQAQAIEWAREGAAARPNEATCERGRSDPRLNGGVELGFHAYRPDIGDVSGKLGRIMGRRLGRLALGYALKLTDLRIGLAIGAQQHHHKMNDCDRIHEMPPKIGLNRAQTSGPSLPAFQIPVGAKEHCRPREVTRCRLR